MGIHTEPKGFQKYLTKPKPATTFATKKHRSLSNDGGLLAQHVLVEATCKPCLAAQGEPRR